MSAAVVMFGESKRNHRIGHHYAQSHSFALVAGLSIGRTLGFDSGNGSRVCKEKIAPAAHNDTVNTTAQIFARQLMILPVPTSAADIENCRCQSRDHRATVAGERIHRLFGNQ